MKVGDIVKQGDGVVQFRGKNAPKRSARLGVVVKIHENLFPPEWEITKERRKWMETLGRRVDVLWDNDKLSEGFAEYSLDVVSEELTDDQLELVAGGMNTARFEIWRCEMINESG